MMCEKDAESRGESKIKIEIAKEMLKMNLSEMQIQQATKLSLTAIQELKKEMGL